jgi:hypothetical protein
VKPYALIYNAGVAVFECEGEAADEAMETVMEEAATEAAEVAIGKMHTATARKAVAKEAAMKACA